MNDLINRQVAIKAIEDLQDCYNGFSDTYDKACIIGVLEELPPVQPEIVRCKDCVHYDLAINGYNGNCNRQYATFYADDFCSYGERRGDAK